MHHILGNKVLQYDVDDRGVIVDEREDVSVEVYAENFNDWAKFTGAKYTVTNKNINITNFDAVNNTCIYISPNLKSLTA